MEKTNTLERLLQVEANAASLVKDAQSEADRRIQENEEKNHIAHEERLRSETQLLEASLKNEKEKIIERYQKELDEYRKEISCVSADTERFSALLNQYMEERV